MAPLVSFFILGPEHGWPSWSGWIDQTTPPVATSTLYSLHRYRSCPAKSWTAMIPKMEKAKAQSPRTSSRVGTECSRVFTSFLIPSTPEIVLRGRRNLKDLMAV